MVLVVLVWKESRKGHVSAPTKATTQPPPILISHSLQYYGVRIEMNEDLDGQLTTTESHSSTYLVLVREEREQYFSSYFDTCLGGQWVGSLESC